MRIDANSSGAGERLPDRMVQESEERGYRAYPDQGLGEKVVQLTKTSAYASASARASIKPRAVAPRAGTPLLSSRLPIGLAVIAMESSLCSASFL